MSDLHRSAISARLAKLPPFLQTAQEEDDDDDDDDETVDAIGDLPGSGIGPPAMQVIMIFIDACTKCSYQKLKGPAVTCVQNPSEFPTRISPPFLHLVILKKLRKFQSPCGIWIVVSITHLRNSIMGLLWFATMVQDTRVLVLPVLPRRLQR